MRTIIKTLCAAALMALAVSPAVAEDSTFTANFGALAVGKVTTLTPTHVVWTGAFSGAIFDADKGPFDHAFVICPGTNDLDFKAGKGTISGHCLISDGADSAIVATFACEGTSGTCEKGTATWNDGSGKWQGWTAEVTWTAQLSKALEDGSVPTYAVWTVHYKTP